MSWNTHLMSSLTETRKLSGCLGFCFICDNWCICSNCKKISEGWLQIFHKTFLWIFQKSSTLPFLPLLLYLHFLCTVFLPHYFLTTAFWRSISGCKIFPHFSLHHSWHCQLVDLIPSFLEKFFPKLNHQVHKKFFSLLLGSPSFWMLCTFLSYSFQPQLSGK